MEHWYGSGGGRTSGTVAEADGGTADVVGFTGSSGKRATGRPGGLFLAVCLVLGIVVRWKWKQRTMDWIVIVVVVVVVVSNLWNV